MKNILLLLNLLVVVSLYGNNTDSAEQYLEKLDSKYSEGTLLLNQFKPEKAIEYFESQIERNSPTSISEEIYLQNKLAKSFNDAYLFEETKTLLDSFKHQLLLNNKLDSILYFNATTIIGNAYMKTNLLDLALEHLLEALEGRIKLYGENNLKVAEVQNLLGQLFYYKYNKSNIAYNYYSKALITRNKHKESNPFDLAISNYNMSIYYINQKEYNLSLSYAKGSIQIIEEGEFTHDRFYSKVQNLLATCYFYKDDYKSAIKIGEEIIKLNLKEKNIDYYNLIINYLNLGQYYYFENQFVKCDSIVSIIEQTLSKVDSLNFFEQKADLHLLKGHLLFLRNANSLWKEEIATALRIFKDNFGDFSNNIYDIYYDIGEVALEKKLYKIALSNFNKIDSLFQIDNNLHPNSERMTIIINGLSKQAVLLSSHYASDKNLEKAYLQLIVIDSLIQLRKEIENKEIRKVSLINQYNFIYELGIDICYNLYQSSGDKKYLQQSFVFIEHSKAASLNDFVNEKTKMGIDSISPLLKSKLLNINQEMAKLEYLYDLTKDNSILKNLNNLAQEKNAIYQPLNSIDKNHLNKVAQSEQKRINLNKNQVLLDFFNGEKNHFLLIAKGDKLIDLVKYDSNELDEKISNLIPLIYTNEPNYKHSYRVDFSNYASDLFNYLFENNQWIKSVKEVVIIPDGKISLIPFEVLLTNTPSNVESFKDLPYWLLNANFCYSYSYQTFNKNNVSTKTKNLNALVFGYHTDNDLIYSQDELNAISKNRQIKADIVINGTKLDYLKKSKDVDVIHFALHTTINDTFKYGNCLLLNSNQTNNDSFKLYDYEILNHPLNANLVVLNACETNLGLIALGEGVFNLSRSFKCAGVKNIISNLWKVNGRSANEISTVFYQKLLKTKDPITALNDSKREYLKNSNSYSSNPYYWSAAIIYGENSTPKNKHHKYIIFIIIGVLFIILYFIKKLKYI